MDKWEKVVALHRLLSASRYSVRLGDALRELECSEATFHRIRAFLKTNLGAPLVFDRRYGGYRYDESEGKRFEVPGLWFTKRELEALLTLDHAVEALQEGLFGRLFGPLRERLEKALQAQGIRPAVFRKRLKILGMATRGGDTAVFKTLAEAVLGRTRLTITHRRFVSDEAVTRTVSPQTLVRYRDNWYLDAFCHLRNELRTFGVDRIEEARRAPGKCRRVPESELAAFFAQSYGIFTGPATKTAEIVFRDAAAREVSREQWHPRQRGEWRADGSYVLLVPYGHSRELVMDVLRWGDMAEVVGPEELREEVKKRLAGALGRYGD